MKKKFDIVTIGGATLDIMFALKKVKLIKSKDSFSSQRWLVFPWGSKIVSQDVVYTCGGGAANTAVSFAKLGLKTAMLSSMGDDHSAQIILEKLKENKVDISLKQKVDNYTALSFIVTGGSKKEHVIFSHRSANDLLEVSQNKLKNIKSKWYYLSSLSGKKWKGNLNIIFAAVKTQGIKIAWNPGSIQLEAGYKNLKKFFPLCDVLLLNKSEAIQLVATSGIKAKSFNELFKIILGWGCKIVAITQGEKGAYVCSKEIACFRKSLPIRGINTTGAGDAFGSSLVGGLMIYKNDLKKALDLAIIRSSYVVRKIGAQKGLLTLAEIKKLKYKI
ncbi:carbohydrate kinase family protein [Patescibacteria group bacterium]|nr:carbohydrate kinase family protein [Patescibacteria group bacterium]